MAATSEIDLTQYLSFRLEEEVFAIEISKVREVLEFVSLTKVPQTPPYMKGVINIRGSVVPVVDLKYKFGMNETLKTINTCIIIVEVRLNGNNTVIGALTDSVSEVFEMESKNIEAVPRIGTQMNVEFIKGMGKRDGEFIIILDIDKVFCDSEIESMADIAEAKDEFFGMNN